MIKAHEDLINHLTEIIMRFEDRKEQVSMLLVLYILYLTSETTFNEAYNELQKSLLELEKTRLNKVTSIRDWRLKK